MKTRNLIFAGALALTVMSSGCADATAKLSDSSTVLMSVGSTNITKGDLYSLMNATAGASTAVTDATRTISEQEVEITDDMKSSAQSTLDSYKSMYGDTFDSYLKQSGMSEDDYLNDYLIPSLQADELPTKYIEDNWKSVISLYKPVKVILLSFSSQTDAEAALASLKAGTATAADAASANNSDSTGEAQIYTIESDDVDSMVRTVLTNGSPDDGWVMVSASDGSTFVDVQIQDNDPDNFKDDCITALKSVDQVSSDATTYYYKKYKFHVYDITIYNAMKTSYPDNLVQDVNDDSSAEAVAESVANALDDSTGSGTSSSSSK